MKINKFSIAPLVFLLAGCGGGGNVSKNISSSASRGSVAVTISWPTANQTKSREIPQETQSLAFTVLTLTKQPDETEYTEDVELRQLVVQRPEDAPTSEVLFEDLPSVRVRIKVTAHSSTDGSGGSLADGYADVTVEEDATVPAEIVLGSCNRPHRVYAGGVEGTEQDGKWIAEFSENHIVARAELSDVLELSVEGNEGKRFVNASVTEFVHFLSAERDGQAIDGIEAVFTTEFTHPERYEYTIQSPGILTQMNYSGRVGPDFLDGTEAPPAQITVPVEGTYRATINNFNLMVVEIKVGNLEVDFVDVDEDPVTLKLKFVGFQNVPEGVEIIADSCLGWADKRAGTEEPLAPGGAKVAALDDGCKMNVISRVPRKTVPGS